MEARKHFAVLDKITWQFIFYDIISIMNTYSMSRVITHKYSSFDNSCTCINRNNIEDYQLPLNFV